MHSTRALAHVLTCWKRAKASLAHVKRTEWTLRRGGLKWWSCTRAWGHRDYLEYSDQGAAYLPLGYTGGSREKYSLSLGLEVSSLKRKVKETESDLPGYFCYRRLFEVCDNLSRSLHDRHWPYKRGSRGHPGDLGKLHDSLLCGHCHSKHGQRQRLELTVWKRP